MAAPDARAGGGPSREDDVVLARPPHHEPRQGQPADDVEPASAGASARAGELPHAAPGDHGRSGNARLSRRRPVERRCTQRELRPGGDGAVRARTAPVHGGRRARGSEGTRRLGCRLGHRDRDRDRDRDLLYLERAGLAGDISGPQRHDRERRNRRWCATTRPARVGWRARSTVTSSGSIPRTTGARNSRRFSAERERARPRHRVDRVAGRRDPPRRLRSASGLHPAR